MGHSPGLAVRKLGIRVYLLVVLGIMSVLPTLLLSMITTTRESRAELERVDRDARARARSVARELDQFIATQVASIELLAGEVEAAGLQSPLLQSLLSRHRQHSPQLSFAYIADKDGTSLYADPPTDADGKPTAGTSYRDRDYYRELVRTGHTAISRVQLGKRSGVPNVQVVAPIHDAAGQFVAYAEGSIDLHSMHDAVAHVIEGVSDSRVIVVDGHRRVLADSTGQLGVLADASVLKLDDEATADEHGQPVRAAVESMHNVGWTVNVLRDSSSVDDLVAAARRDTLVVGLLSLVLALLVVAFGVYWLGTPIRALAAATAAVGRGDFSKPVPQPRAFESHEVAELLESVRVMARDVKHYREHTTELIDGLRTMVVGVEHAGNPVEIANAEGKLEYVNPAWVKLTGVSSADAVGRSFVELLAIDRSFELDIWSILLRGESWRGLYPSRNSAGKLVEFELNAVPVMRPDGAISHIVATRIDISEQRRAEEKMRMNDRLAAVGMLAAGVAHEINNPLTYVSANLAHLRNVVVALRDKLTPTEAKDSLAAFDEIRTGVGRVTNIVADLRQLSRPDEHATTIVDVNALLDSCVRMAGPHTRHVATVVTEYGKLPRMDANEARLSQVFLNLIVNAAQACAGDPTTNKVTIRTHAADDTITVEISDTGHGMAPEVIEHIFDAFFTTKPVGAGTGLGLSISHGIVEQLGGKISASSTVGVGSTFTVTLPVHAAVARREPITAKIEKRRRILLVDDEAGITSSLSRMLREHEVTVARSAREALAEIERTKFDVILSDVMMPDVDGFELYRRACAAQPGCAAHFVFMTGGVIHPDIADKLATLERPCLYKPFSLEQLRDAIASVGAA
jgi:two-component system, NtrC family, sensor kinase